MIRADDLRPTELRPVELFFDAMEGVVADDAAPERENDGPNSVTRHQQEDAARYPHGPRTDDGNQGGDQRGQGPQRRGRNPQQPERDAEQYGGDVLKPGVVFTIEPGLYYPSRGMGVRIEDTFCCLPDGSFESLTPFPYDLVIPLEQ